jgi:hypothetical protein
MIQDMTQWYDDDNLSKLRITNLHVFLKDLSIQRQ